MGQFTHITSRNHVISLFALFFLVLGLYSSAHAAPIFGPKSFVRDTGTPPEFQQLFQCGGSASTYKLIIANGNPDGSNRVTSAHVWLNGQEVVGPESFNKQVAEIRTFVTLLPSNDFRIRIEGSPDGILSIRISAVIGTSGGFVASSGGARLSVPPGALDQEVEASIDDVAFTDLGVTLPSGFNFIRGVAIDLGGKALANEADLAISAMASPTDHLIVARTLQLGTSTRLVMADTASLGSDGQIHTNSPPFPGVRSGGTFAFLQMPSDLGILGINVRRNDGTAVRGAIVSTFISQLSADSQADAVAAALRSEATFVGESDATGFAAVPTAAPNTTVAVFASAPAQVTGVTLAGMVEIGLPGLQGPPSSLIGLVNDVIIEHLFSGLNPPQQIEPCDCTTLDIDPKEIPSGNSAFETGMTPVPLTVRCLFKNVTVSNPLSPLSGFNTLLTGGINSFTGYVPEDRTIATVDQSGNVTAIAPGKTSIHVFHYELSAETVNGVIIFHQCDSFGLVPITVSGRLTIAVSGTGSGTVQSGDGEIDCPGNCSATFSPGASVNLTASPALGSVFTAWGGDCNGTSATTSVLLTVDRSCTATFTSVVPTIFVVVHGDHGLGCCNNNLYDLRPGGSSLFTQQGETISASFGQKTTSVQYHVFEDGATTDGEGGNIDVYVVGPPGTAFHLDYTFVQSATASNQSTGAYLSGVIMQGLADLSVSVQPGFSDQKSVSGGSAVDGVTTSQTVAFLGQTYSLAWSAGHLIEVGANTCCGSYTGHAEGNLVVNLTVP